MKQGSLAIFHEEVEYAKNFMDYINQCERINIDTIVFTKEDYMKQYVREHCIDLLMVGEEAVVTDLVPYVKKIIILSDGNTVFEESKYKIIYRYQSMEQIITEILYICEENGICQHVGKLPDSEKSTKVIGVFSVNNDIKKDVLGITLGQEYAKTKKTLLINLEFFSYNYSEEVINEEGLSELIYFLKQKESKGIELERFVKRLNGLDCILPVQHYSDLYELNEEDMMELISQLKCNSTYEVVILVLDFMNSYMVHLFELCERIYMPVSENNMEQAKKESFFHMLKLEQKEKLIDHFFVVSVPEETTTGVISNESKKKEYSKIVSGVI